MANVQDKVTRFSAEITAAVEEKLESTDFGAELAAEGVTTVALDETGRLVEYRADGSCSVLVEA